MTPSSRARAVRIPKKLNGMEHTIFLKLVEGAGFGVPTPEFKFDADRKWRFDYAFPHVHVAVEVEGGAYSRGRHVRPLGFIADLEKYSEAAVQGWVVIRVTPQQLPTPETIALLHRAFQFKTQGTP